MQVQLDTIQSNQNLMITDIALVKQEQSGIKRDVEVKHEQNRKSIHELANLVQRLVDDNWKMKIANARWNVGAGVVTAVIIKTIDHFSK